jgi:hypothetical protein
MVVFEVRMRQEIGGVGSRCQFKPRIDRDSHELRRATMACTR